MKNIAQFLGLILAISSALYFGCSNPKSATQEIAKSVAPYATLGSIEIYDSTLLDILDPDAKIEILAQGFDWVEGPVWIEDGSYLLFSDILPNTVYKWKEGDSTSIYLTPSGYTDTIPRGGEIGSNGLMLNQNGQLLLCQHGDRRIAVMDAPLSNPNSNYLDIARVYNGMKFNSPNDLVVHSSGDIYFTDPPYGLEKNMDDPLKEIDFQGVYRWSASDSSVTLLHKDIPRPNGIEFSTDEKLLYVADSDGESPLWFVFDVNDEGSISNRQELLEESTLGIADGMVVHSSGIIFATGPNGVWIISASGQLLGKINTNERTANCTFDQDKKTLYITADSYLLRVKMIK